MKRIIKGKLYNTDTAKEISSWDNGILYTDFRFIEETLYKKKTGEFFLFCQGGAMTCYREVCGDGQYCSGSNIIPVTIEEAKKWMEKLSDVDAYTSVFGNVEE